jgi:hypothetical protein
MLCVETANNFVEDTEVSKEQADSRYTVEIFVVVEM